MIIKNIVIKDAWSFRSDNAAEISFTPVTIIIGKNNSGKSNVLRCLRWLEKSGLSDKPKLERLELYDYGTDQIKAKPELAFSFRITKDEAVKLSANLGNENFTTQTTLEYVEKLATEIQVTYKARESTDKDITLSAKWNFAEPVVSLTSSRIAAYNGHKAQIDGDLKNSKDHVHEEMCKRMRSLIKSKLTYLSAWRDLQSNVEGDKAMIKVLHEMHGASASNPRLLREFNRVQAFFVNIARLEEAQLRPSADGRELNIYYRERLLPIQSFGDGIVQALRFGFEFMRRSNNTFLIEEPETHLHPELIRKLMAEITNDRNGNKFIITTHSPILLNKEHSGTTYLVEYNGDCSTCRPCETNADTYRVLDALGVRLSDLLQAECVIWVEGPTDRMFIKRCLELLAPALKEGTDFQVAYYGGKLLSHVTLVGDTDRFVNILRLCRHAAIVCDSDCDVSGEPISATKERIKKEVTESNGCFWVTAGREIENYIPDTVVSATYKKLLPNEDPSLSVGQFDRIEDVLAKTWPTAAHGDGWKVKYADNKLSIMPLFMEQLTGSDLNRYGLREDIDRVIAFIMKSNAVEQAPQSGVVSQ